MYLGNANRRRSSKIPLNKNSDFNNFTEKHEIPFKSVLLFLGIIGAIPFTWKKPHIPSLHPTKSTIIIAIITYTGVLTSVSLVLNCYGGRLINESLPLNEKMLFTEMLLICCFVSVNATLWTDISTINHVINSWLQLTIMYHQLTNRKLSVRWRRVEKCLIIIILIFPTTIFLLGKETNPELQPKYEYGLHCVHSAKVVFLTSVLWIGYFGHLKALAKDLRNDLNERVELNLLSVEKLQIYRDIWIEMRNLSDLLSSMNAPILICILSVAALILFIYEFLVILKLGKYLAALPHVMLAMMLLILLTCMARASHVAIEQLKLLFSGILARQALVSMKETTQRQIINMYLIENLRTPTPSYGGFIIVNKALVSSIFAAISMYLVVLVQLTTQSNKS